MSTSILNLPIGTRFAVTGMPQLRGVLAQVAEGRVLVRLDRPAEIVEFQRQDGSWVRFRRGNRLESFSRATIVDVLRCPLFQ